jgi:uncharacterized membrane protein
MSDSILLVTVAWERTGAFLVATLIGLLALGAWS